MAYFTSKSPIVWGFDSSFLRDNNMSGITADEAVERLSNNLEVDLSKISDGSVPITFWRHYQDGVVVVRVSKTRCVYFEREQTSVNVQWDNHYDHYVKVGKWAELAKNHALEIIKANRRTALRRLYCQQSEQSTCTEVDSTTVHEPYSWEYLAADREMVVKLKDLSFGAKECSLSGIQEDLTSPFVSIPCRGCATMNTEDLKPIKLSRCKQQAFGGGGSPSPRECEVCGEGPCTMIPVNIVKTGQNLPNLAFVGIDWGAKKDTSHSVEVAYQGSVPLSMKMEKILEPGIWVICTTAGPEIDVLIVNNRTELDTEIPAVRLTTQTHFKTPVEMREPVLPKDFGKTVWWSEPDMSTRERPSHSSGRLVGQSDGGKVLIVERGHGTRTTYVRRQYAFIVDQPADGF
jgi:hypothetical protein